MREVAAGNIYDFPQYFDLLFRDETTLEVDFFAEAFRRYARRPVRRVLEPGCGGGRLIVELARRGFQPLGFDSSEKALQYLQRRLARRQLTAQTWVDDLARFTVRPPVDAAVCTFNTFRHLLTEADAAEHLRRVAQAIRPGGLYILGFHVLPLDVDEGCVERWRAKAGSLEVTCTLRILSASRRKRQEQVRLAMLVRRPQRTWRLRTEFPLRMYTGTQFRRLLARVPEFELCDVFDFWYEIDSPLPFDDELTDAVFVLRRRS
jgi:SAM-dependent methyltransferase